MAKASYKFLCFSTIMIIIIFIVNVGKWFLVLSALFPSTVVSITNIIKYFEIARKYRDCETCVVSVD